MEWINATTLMKIANDIRLLSSGPRCSSCFPQIKNVLHCSFWISNSTGHYVKRVEKNNEVELHRGFDTTKDQSYFLFATTMDQLRFLRFPRARFIPFLSFMRDLRAAICLRPTCNMSSSASSVITLTTSSTAIIPMIFPNF